MRAYLELLVPTDEMAPFEIVERVESLGLKAHILSLCRTKSWSFRLPLLLTGRDERDLDIAVRKIEKIRGVQVLSIEVEQPLLVKAG